MRRYIVLTIVLLVGTLAQAQTTIHLDKPYYLAGEQIFFSFCNTTMDTDSASAQVRLYNNTQVVDTYYVSVLVGCGEGHLKLPFQSATGTYNLEVLLFCGEDFEPATLARVPVSIFNDADRTLLGDRLVSGQSTPAHALLGDIIEETIQSGPSMEIPFAFEIPAELRDQVARVSISVRDQDIYGDKLGTVHRHKPLLPLKDVQWGIPFYGRRVNQEESQIRNPLLFALNAENLHFDASEVNFMNQEFTMPLTPFYESKQINFLDYLDDSVKIERKPRRDRPIVQESYSVDSLLIQHLDIYQEEKTINQVFQQIGLPVLKDSTNLISLPMEPNYTADVQDFAIRGTTVSLFKELITPLKFRSIGKSNYRARMLYERNNIKKYYSRPPLFVVNGRATRNGPFVAKFPLQEIGFFRIYSLYDDLEQISPMAFGGIVFVDMMDPNYVLSDQYAQPAFEVQGMQLPVNYPIVPKFSEGAPTIGPLLYWDPNMNIENGEIRCNFRSMQTKSDYLIEVVMHLVDTAEPRVHRQLLQVGNE